MSSSDIRLHGIIKGKYKYDRMHNGAPAYKRTTYPRLYLYWANNRWLVWKNLGQTYYCDPWWAFWNCREVYGWIRYEYDYQCPGQVNNQWQSGLTHDVDNSIQVKCTQDNTETTTIKPCEFLNT